MRTLKITTPAVETFSSPSTPHSPPPARGLFHIDPDNDDRFLDRDRREERDEADLDRLRGR